MEGPKPSAMNVGGGDGREKENKLGNRVKEVSRVFLAIISSEIQHGDKIYQGEINRREMGATYLISGKICSCNSNGHDDRP